MIRNLPEYCPVLIVGAGPAGSTTSLFLEKSGIDHILIDKASFPRDKICGDALSGKVVSVLADLGIDYLNEVENDPVNFRPCHGISFISPSGSRLSVPFKTKAAGKETAAGFLSRRIDFDHFLVKHIKPGRLFESCELVSLEEKPDGIIATVKQNGIVGSIRADLVIGAEGERSIVAKQLAGYVKSKEHYSASVRAYFSGVAVGPEKEYIELHFLDKALPGYLWIFPMTHDLWNVGVIVPSETVSAKKINLKNLLDDLIQNHPLVKDRFVNAKMETPVMGWGLPLGSRKWKLSGSRFLLAGDSGSLIDPFTGEGIGNAMFMGKLAAEAAKKAVEAGNFSAQYLTQYEKSVYDSLWQELKIGKTLLRLLGFPSIFNFVIRKASTNDKLKETITCMFEDIGLRDKMRNPLFYIKLLLNR